MNGEHEYYHDVIIKACSLEEAEAKLTEYAKGFYDKGDPGEDDGKYWFFGGEIVVTPTTLRLTTKRDWMEKQFELKGI